MRYFEELPEAIPQSIEQLRFYLNVTAPAKYNSNAVMVCGIWSIGTDLSQLAMMKEVKVLCPVRPSRMLCVTSRVFLS